MKSACVIQGNVRYNTELIINFLQKKFDIVILSTWQTEKNKVIDFNCIKIFNTIPSNNGFSNRNLQQLTTINGLKKAKELGCDYVLKWRTDMLPLKIDINDLYDLSTFNVEHGMNSRIVTLAYRTYTTEVDWFSSIPDIFSFGHIDDMILLWNDEEYDYSKSYNAPNQMLNDLHDKNIIDLINESTWTSESQLYARFRVSLQKKFHINNLEHELIIKKYFKLVKISRYKIIWFNNEGWFRSIFQSYEHNWWTVNDWLGKSRIKKNGLFYQNNSIVSKFKIKLNSIIILYNCIHQYIQFNFFKINSFIYGYHKNIK
jgi:hypothetical protein